MRLPLIVISFFFPFYAVADGIGPNPSARALGMGNAYVATVDNVDSLFYNPASLAKVHGVQLNFFSANAAGKNLTDYNTLKSLADPSTDLSTAIPPLYGKNFYYGGGGRTAVALPMFGAAMYDSVSAQASVHNPPYTQIDVNVVNDYAYALGFGVPIGPFVQLGAEGRYIKRTGTTQTYSGGTLASLSSNQIADDIQNWGIGYEFDMGANFIVPMPMFTYDFSIVWQNIGNTAFQGPPTNHIAAEPANLVFGMGLDVRLPLVSIRPEIDFRHANDSEMQLFRKFNFGVEVSLPLIDIRGGFSEGYFTYGVGVGFGPLHVDAASYAAELGDYPGQIEDRRYMAQFSLELDVGSFGVDDSKSDPSAKGGKGSSSSNGSNNSFWGGAIKPKERR